MTNTKGFTLIEILIVVAIVGILGSIVTFAFARYARVRAVDGVVRLIASELNDARSRTLAARAGVSHGVHIDDTEIVLFQGSSYDAGDASNETVTLDERAVVSDLNLTGGGSDIVFERLTGETDAYGTIVVSAVTDATVSATVTVQQTGLVAYE